MNLYERIAITHLRQCGLPCEHLKRVIVERDGDFGGSFVVRTANEIQHIGNESLAALDLLMSRVLSSCSEYRKISLLKVRRTLNYEVRVISEVDEHSDVADWDEDVFSALVESIVAKQRGIFRLRVQVVEKATNQVLSELVQNGCLLDVSDSTPQCDLGLERSMVRKAVWLARKNRSLDHVVHG